MRAFSVALLFLAGCTGSTTNAPKESQQPNNKPIAEAGTAITQTADTAVALNGSQSRDPDGDPLTYHWSFDHVPEGSLVPNREAPFTSNNTTSATSSFMADTVGTYVIRLEVSDSRGAMSDPDFVIITIEDPTTLPVANAGPDVTAMVGQTVTLSGSGSYDPQGRPFTYLWTILDKPSTSASTLSGDTSVAPTLIPDVKGVYVVNLVTNNGLASSHGDAMTITALADDHAPVANAGIDVETEDCTSVQLDCSQSSDPDHDPLQYQWTIQSKPSNSSASDSVSFSDRTSSRPTFYPDQAGNYVLSCAVYDGTTWSTPDLMNIAATERRRNTPPTVNAGPNEQTDGGSASCTAQGYSYTCDDCADLSYTLGLNATVSDPDGDPYTVLWSVDEGDATISDPTVLSPTVVMKNASAVEPGQCEENEYVFRLTATDCTGESEEDIITIVVNCCGVEDTSGN